MSERRTAQLLAAATLVVVLAVLVDIGRRSARTPSVAPAAAAPDTTPAPAPADAVGPPAGVATQPGATVLPQSGPSYMEQVARAEARRQIRASAGRTYLNDIVAAAPDSMLHRWDDRYERPVRVYVPRTSRTANFQPAFAEAIVGAFRTWEAVGLPVRFDVAADSAGADVRVRWRVQFEEERTGQTDLEWDADGHIVLGEMLLATFDPDGSPMGPDEVRVVALHEIGHVLGLDHSPDSTDLMHPIAKVRHLSRRDIETARLLYRLAPGSLR
jgi:predicted Zn-dependent protease